MSRVVTIIEVTYLTPFLFDCHYSSSIDSNSSAFLIAVSARMKAKGAVKIETINNATLIPDNQGISPDATRIRNIPRVDTETTANTENAKKFPLFGDRMRNQLSEMRRRTESPRLYFRAIFTKLFAELAVNIKVSMKTVIVKTEIN